MPSKDIRDGLLAALPPATDLPTYSKQVAAALEKNRKRIRVEKVSANVFWIFCAVSAAMYIWFGNAGAQYPRAPFLACIFLLLGGIEILKHRIHATQVELQKEMKQLQLQILELQAALLRGPTGGK